MWMADHIWDIWATTGFPWILEWFPFTWIQNSPKCTYVQNLRCIPTTPSELFLTSSFIKVWWNIPSIAASSFNLPTACFSPSYSLLPNNTRELGKKNCSQRMYMFDLMVGLRNLINMEHPDRNHILIPWCLITPYAFKMVKKWKNVFHVFHHLTTHHFMLDSVRWESNGIKVLLSKSTSSRARIWGFMLCWGKEGPE